MTWHKTLIDVLTKIDQRFFFCIIICIAFLFQIFGVRTTGKSDPGRHYRNLQTIYGAGQGSERVHHAG